jgi:hypothetical protein
MRSQDDAGCGILLAVGSLTPVPMVRLRIVGTWYEMGRGRRFAFLGKSCYNADEVDL